MGPQPGFGQGAGLSGPGFGAGRDTRAAPRRVRYFPSFLADVYEERS